MANRSYLYASDHLPGSAEWAEKKELRSIAEYRYDIPLLFRVLLSGKPVAVRSSIWDTPQLIAIAGDARTGLDRLLKYIDLLPEPAKDLVAETREFFAKPENVRKYFILEGGEIFELSDRDLAAQNLALISEIGAITDDVSRLYLPPRTGARATMRSFFWGIVGRLLRAPPADPLAPYYEIGLGAWTNILYFDFAPQESGSPDEWTPV